MTVGYADAALLFRRAGFGATDAEIRRYQNWQWSDLVNLVLDTSRAPGLGQQPDLSEGRNYSEKWESMVHYWLDRARRPVDQAPIVEKMTLFWHGHLCSALNKTHRHKAMFEQNQMFRAQGMGNFDGLIRSTAIDPAMLDYLDNARNTKDRLNENFARELMELFVLGVGHYTEDDVKEATRAWTGHGLTDVSDYYYQYRFNSGDHDNGTKTFLGQSGNFDGFDILNILLTKKRDAHAKFLCSRLWSFFAYPVQPNDSVVADIAAAYKPGLNITAAVRAIFLHSKFRSDATRNGLVRSPVEWTVALMRHTRLDSAQLRPEWNLRPLGQTLFNPPNVSGWKQNEYWLNEPALWAKADLADRARWTAFKRGDIEDVHEVIDWNPVTFKHTPVQAIDMAIANYQLEPLSSQTRQVLVDYIQTERNSDKRWGERSGLLMLPFLTPEMQMA